MTAESKADRGAPMKLAIEGEIEVFLHLSIRLWQTTAAIGIIAGLVVAATISVEVGLTASLCSAFYLAWTVPAAWRLSSKTKMPAWAKFAIDVVESSAPWSFLAVMAHTQGGDYALGSWVPPMLFCLVVFQNVLRLRIIAPVVMGALAGVTFPLLYLFVVRAEIPPEQSEHLLFGLPMQISRGVSLFILGIGGSLSSRALRGAIFRAEGLVREKDLFGKYRILGTIARGGMGEVLEALYCPEGGFERRVAIKRIHPHLAEQERFVAQFRTEAELCARLAHPNIVQVFDFGRVDDTYFLAMEFVEGVNLGKLLSSARARGLTIPEHVVGAIARGICEGLDHAHSVALGPEGERLRVVHRDICPQNVMISTNGEVKLSDFGVARALKDAESSVTRHVVGHAAYMAPEQARAEAIDRRSDLWGIGVVVWELLLVRRLFYRDNDPATLDALLHGDVPRVSSERPNLDPGWDSFLDRAIARNPDSRFQSAREMINALGHIPASQGEGATQQLAMMVSGAVKRDAV